MEENKPVTPVNNKPLTHEEFSRRGGQAKFEKYGKEALSEMGKKGGNSLKEKMGQDYYQELGRKAAAKRWGKKIQ